MRKALLSILLLVSSVIAFNTVSPSDGFTVAPQEVQPGEEVTVTVEDDSIYNQGYWRRGSGQWQVFRFGEQEVHRDAVSTQLSFDEPGRYTIGIYSAEETDDGWGYYGDLGYGLQVRRITVSDGETVEDDSRSTASCSNSRIDGLETDVDCGGPACAPCGADNECEVAGDCKDGLTCSEGICRPLSSCELDVQEARQYGNQPCTTQSALMACPDGDMTHRARNGCVLSSLREKGWTRVNDSDDGYVGRSEREQDDRSDGDSVGNRSQSQEQDTGSEEIPGNDSDGYVGPLEQDDDDGFVGPPEIDSDSCTATLEYLQEECQKISIRPVNVSFVCPSNEEISWTARSACERRVLQRNGWTQRSYNTCQLENVSVLSQCENCEQSDAVRLRAATSGDCGDAEYLQADLSGEGCTVEYTGGDISGVGGNASVTGDLTTTTWSVPSLPRACQDVTVTGDAAALWPDLPLRSEHPITSTMDVSGEISFGDGSGQDETVEAQITLNPDQIRDFDGGHFQYQNIVFSAGRSTGPVANHTWNIDGELFRGERVTSSFETPGEYTVGLNVAGSSDVDNVTRTITVQEAQDHPPDHAPVRTRASEATVGDVVNVTLSMTEDYCTDHGQLFFMYDAEALQYRDHMISSAFGSGNLSLASTNLAGPGDWRMSYASAGNHTFEQGENVVTLQFNALQSGVHEVRLPAEDQYPNDIVYVASTMNRCRTDDDKDDYGLPNVNVSVN